MNSFKNIETFRNVINQYDITNDNLIKNSVIQRTFEEAMVFSNALLKLDFIHVEKEEISIKNYNITFNAYNSLCIISDFYINDNNTIEITHNLFKDKNLLNNQAILVKSIKYIVFYKNKKTIENRFFSVKNNIYSAYKGIVKSIECDQMSHMNVQFYFEKHSHAIKNLFNEINSIINNEITYTIKNERCIFSKEVNLDCALEIVFSLKSIVDNELILLTKIFSIDNKNVSAFFEVTIIFDSKVSLKDVIKNIFLSNKNTYLNDFNFENLRNLTDERPSKKIAKNAVTTLKNAVNTWDIGSDKMGTSKFKINCVSDAATHLFTLCGADYNWRTKFNIGSAALDYSVRYYSPARLGMAVSLRSNFTKIGNKSLKFIHHMIDEASGKIILDIEVVAVLFDLVKRKSIIVPEEFKEKANDLIIKN
jgi:acyl-CoA thioesterase FadM